MTSKILKIVLLTSIVVVLTMVVSGCISKPIIKNTNDEIKNVELNTNQNINTDQQETPIFNPDAVNKPMDEWLTYKNEEYEFEFTYPEGKIENSIVDNSTSEQFEYLSRVDLGKRERSYLYISPVKSWIKYDVLSADEKYEKNTKVHRPHILRKEIYLDKGRGFYEFELWENTEYKPMPPVAEFFNSKHHIVLKFSYNIPQEYVEKVSQTFRFYEE